MFSFAFSEQIRNADCPVYTEIRGGRPIHGNDNDDNEDDEQAMRYKQIIILLILLYIGWRELLYI